MRTLSQSRRFSIAHVSTFGGLTGIAVLALHLGLAAGCGSGGPVSPQTKAEWPKASGLSTTALPDGVGWVGVYFIHTPGTRGTMHIMASRDDRFYGCWLAEDKHARATFTGIARDNVMQLDWVERRVNFAGAPAHVSGYFVLTPKDDGKHALAGEYGEDQLHDTGSSWEAIRQKNQEPSPDACKLDEGDTVQPEGRPLE